MKKLIINAKRIFSNPVCSDADSILILDGKIAAVGNREDFCAEVRSGAEIIDAENRPVLPGFIDAHNHFSLLGLQQHQINLDGLLCKGQICECLKKAAETIPEDQPVIAYNYEYEFIDPSQRITAEDLDQILPGRLVHINERTGHISVSNRYTLVHAGICPESTGCSSPEKPGTFTGLICGKTNSKLDQFFQKKMHTPENLEKAWTFAAEQAVSKGVTGLHMICMEEDFELINRYKENLPLRIRIYDETKNVDSVYRSGLRQIGGCGKVIVDGDTGPYTAAFLEPYIDRQDAKGTLYYSDEELNDYVAAAHRRGMQIGLHCVGDAASTQMLNAIESAQKTDGKQLRHRIEHFEFASSEMIRRARDLGVCLVIQPTFNHYWPHTSYLDTLGEERADHADMIATLCKAGAIVGFGSDSPVTPCDPLLTIHSAVNHSNPKERIPAKTAIAIHTYGSAYCGCEESFTGTITPGKAADLVILDEDPTETDAENIKNIRVIKTISAGNVVYAR